MSVLCLSLLDSTLQQPVIENVNYASDIQIEDRPFLEGK